MAHKFWLFIITVRAHNFVGATFSRKTQSVRIKSTAGEKNKNKFFGSSKYENVCWANTFSNCTWMTIIVFWNFVFTFSPEHHLERYFALYLDHCPAYRESLQLGVCWFTLYLYGLLGSSILQYVIARRLLVTATAWVPSSLFLSCYDRFHWWPSQKWMWLNTTRRITTWSPSFARTCGYVSSATIPSVYCMIAWIYDFVVGFQSFDGTALDIIIVMQWMVLTVEERKVRLFSRWTLLGCKSAVVSEPVL